MKECDLMATGEPFDEKGYGIGVPLGATYRDDLTMAILSLGERGVIKKLEDRYLTRTFFEYLCSLTQHHACQLLHVSIGVDFEEGTGEHAHA